MSTPVCRQYNLGLYMGAKIESGGDCCGWQNGRMYRLHGLAVLCLAVGPMLPADAATVTGRVLDESGGVPPGVRVLADDAAIPVGGDGRFRIDTEAPLVQIKISADGHYGFLHTVESVVGELPDITLVKHLPERRLLMFAGDAMLARRYFEPRDGEPVLVRREHVAEDGAALLRAVTPYVELADFASVNLETQLAAEQPAEPLPKSVTFFSPPELAALLRNAGFDYVALGNNHTYDYRDAGLDSTIEAVTRAGLGWSGAGSNSTLARQPYVVDIDGHVHSFASYVGWAGGFEPNQVAGPDKGGAALGNEAVFAADSARLVGVSVLQYHAGLEYSETPALSERTSLRFAVDQGVDVAIGHHAHVLQGLEIYRDRLIAYSMGNFLFDQYHYSTQLGMLLYVWMDGERFHRAEIVPLHINGYVPTPATGNLRKAVLGRLARLSAPFGTCLVESGAHAAISVQQSPADCRPQKVAISPGTTSQPVALFDFLSPLRPVQVLPLAQYRVGVDILHRGDFEYAGRFGIADRAWIAAENVSIVDGETRELQISVAPGAGPVTAGLGRRA